MYYHLTYLYFHKFFSVFQEWRRRKAEAEAEAEAEAHNEVATRAARRRLTGVLYGRYTSSPTAKYSSYALKPGFHYCSTACRMSHRRENSSGMDLEPGFIVFKD